MQLGQTTGPRPADDVLWKETAYALAASSLATKTFGTGQPLVSGIKETAEFYKTPERNDICRVFLALRDYAYDDCHDVEVPADDVYHAFAFTFSMVPVAEFFSGQSASVFEQVLNTAYARDKLREFSGDQKVICGYACVLDYEQSMLPSGLAGGLTIYEMAQLAQLREQSVRNALQRDPKIPRETGSHSKQVEVPIKAAFEWLKQKEGFNWHQPAQSAGEILVPVAKDGSFFSVKCRQGKGFSVGRKGSEKYYKTVGETLDALKAMDSPYWRRPSPTSGTPGIVKGVRWIAKTPEEIGLE
ncbi:MAG: hypothetical protein V7742_14045 [Halioglobus sp.]